MEQNNIKVKDRAIQPTKNLHEDLISQGRSLQDAGQLQKAIFCYQSALQINPNHDQALSLLGQALSQTGNYREAVQSYRIAISLSPHKYEHLYNLGLVFLQHQQIREAKSCFEKALDISPADYEATVNLGHIYKRLREWESAVACYQKAISLQPNRSEAYNNLGVVLQETNNHSLAIESYKKAAGIDPKNTEAFFNMGNALSQIGQVAQSLKYLERAIALNSKFIPAYNLTAKLLSMLHRDEEAIECLKTAVQIDRTSELSLTNLGRLYIKANRYKEALQVYRRVVTANPRSQSALLALGDALFKLNHLQDSIRCYMKILELNPRNPLAYNHLGIALKAAKQLQQAAECFRKAIELSPDACQPYYNLGNTHMELKQHQSAVELFEKAKEANPSNAVVYHSLGLALRLTNKRAKALQCFKRSVELGPSAETFYSLGVHYTEEGSLKNAIDCYAKAFELQPDNPQYFSSYCHVLMIGSDSQKAYNICLQRLQRRPTSPKMYICIGEVLHKLNMNELAFECYVKAKEFDPTLSIFLVQPEDSLSFQKLQDRIQFCLKHLQYAQKDKFYLNLLFLLLRKYEKPLPILSKVIKEKAQDFYVMLLCRHCFLGSSAKIGLNELYQTITQHQKGSEQKIRVLFALSLLFWGTKSKEISQSFLRKCIEKLILVQDITQRQHILNEEIIQPSIQIINLIKYSSEKTSKLNKGILQYLRGKKQKFMSVLSGCLGQNKRKCEGKIFSLQILRRETKDSLLLFNESYDIHNAKFTLLYYLMVYQEHSEYTAPLFEEAEQLQTDGSQSKIIHLQLAKMRKISLKRIRNKFEQLLDLSQVAQQLSRDSSIAKILRASSDHRAAALSSIAKPAYNQMGPRLKNIVKQAFRRCGRKPQKRTLSSLAYSEPESYQSVSIYRLLSDSAAQKNLPKAVAVDALKEDEDYSCLSLLLRMISLLDVAQKQRWSAFIFNRMAKFSLTGSRNKEHLQSLLKQVLSHPSSALTGADLDDCDGSIRDLSELQISSQNHWFVQNEEELMPGQQVSENLRKTLDIFDAPSEQQILLQKLRYLRDLLEYPDKQEFQIMKKKIKQYEEPQAFSDGYICPSKKQKNSTDKKDEESFWYEKHKPVSWIQDSQQGKVEYEPQQLEYKCQRYKNMPNQEMISSQSIEPSSSSREKSALCEKSLNERASISSWERNSYISNPSLFDKVSEVDKQNSCKSIHKADRDSKRYEDRVPPQPFEKKQYYWRVLSKESSLCFSQQLFKKHTYLIRYLWFRRFSMKYLAWHYFEEQSVVRSEVNNQFLQFKYRIEKGGQEFIRKGEPVQDSLQHLWQKGISQVLSFINCLTKGIIELQTLGLFHPCITFKHIPTPIKASGYQERTCSIYKIFDFEHVVKVFVPEKQQFVTLLNFTHELVQFWVKLNNGDAQKCQNFLQLLFDNLPRISEHPKHLKLLEIKRAYINVNEKVSLIVRHLKELSIAYHCDQFRNTLVTLLTHQSCTLSEETVDYLLKKAGELKAVDVQESRRGYEVFYMMMANKLKQQE